MTRGPQLLHTGNTASLPRPLHTAIVGEGKTCMDLFETLEAQGVSEVGLKIVAIFPLPPLTPSIKAARVANLTAFESVEDLCAFSNLDLIVDLTGSSEVAETVLRLKAPSVSFITARTAGFLWNLILANRERARLEEERHQFEEKIKQETQVLLDSLPYRLMVINLDKTITTVNRPFLKEFGFTREEVIGKPCNNIGPGVGRPCRDGSVSCWLDYNLDEIKQKGTMSYIKEYENENLVKGTYFGIENEVESNIESGEGLRINRDRDGKIISKDKYLDMFKNNRCSSYDNNYFDDNESFTEKDNDDNY